MSDHQHPSSGRLSALTVLTAMRMSARNAVAVVIAAAAVLVVVGVVATIWTGLAEAHISGAGWFAMGFGMLVTLALGVGLMALVFISNRRGYDDLGRSDG
jgi:TRAP-type uncharacterized transport system fused permease subunit